MNPSQNELMYDLMLLKIHVMLMHYLDSLHWLFVLLFSNLEKSAATNIVDKLDRLNVYRQLNQHLEYLRYKFSHGHCKCIIAILAYWQKQGHQ